MQLSDANPGAGQPALAGFRLSPQQRRVWSLGGGEPRNPYGASAVVTLTGPLDTMLLETAARQVVERYEILRTTFRSLSEVRLPLQVVGGWPAGLSFASALDEPWDLANGPLLRLRLTAMAPMEHRLTVAAPALCLDAAGLRSFVRELAASYAALAAGREWESEPLQYADLAEWLNGLVEGEEAERWRQMDLARAWDWRLPFAETSAASSGPFAPEVAAWSLKAGEVEQVEALAARLQVTPRAFWLALWHLLLGRHAGASDLLLGVVDDGRTYEVMESALGLFAKSLPVVLKLDPELPFAESVRLAGQCAGEARQLQEYYAGEAEEGPAYLPFGFEYDEEAAPETAGGVAFRCEARACHERFDLSLCVRRAGTAGLFEIRHDPAVLGRETVLLLGEQLRWLAFHALSSPGTAAWELPLLGPAERQRLVVHLQAPECPLPAIGGAHELFERAAREHPERPAARYEDRALSYAELEAWANRLAHRLRRLGVGPEVPVAVFCDRSLEIVVALLAVLKAGGAYAALEPGQPPVRLVGMLADLAAPVILTTRRAASELPPSPACLLCLDEDDLGGEPAAAPPALARRENLAYIIFTSGSTGRPKGVAVEHRQLLSYVASVTERLKLPAGGSYATVSTFAADLGHTMIFPALCAGGCLHVISAARLADASLAAEYFGRHAIDCLKIVPSHLEALLAGPEAARVLPRRKLVLGGEACRPALLDRLAELTPACDVFNHYGPTETTVGVLTERIDPSVAGPAVPLGRPLGNVQVYVLDRVLEPVAVWLTGEIWIGGASVARGYRGHPDRTAERFAPDPLSGSGGARLYRTGDLGRYLPDGRIQFLGRVDDQVKVRGFRVEIGEIETALQAHPSVREVLVLVRDSPPGERRLVAYLIARGRFPGGPEMQSWLGERLPDFMVPSAFVVLERWPLGPNGKIDRGALPEPEPSRAGSSGDRLLPRSPLEEILAGIWASVLGVEWIGATDSFFALGGHSLLATRVIARLRQALGVEVPLRLLFEAPTLAGFAARVQELGGAADLRPGSPPAPSAVDGDAPLSFAQQRLWFLDQLDPGSPLYNIPLALRLRGDLDLPALVASLGEIVRRHRVLRTVFPPAGEGGLPVQRILPAEPFPLPQVDLSALPPGTAEEVARRLAEAEARRPFDLTHGPLLRTVLVQLGGDERALLVTMHHIVSDGWSKGVVTRELAALYAAFVARQPSPLPELPVQYADFARWQRDWLDGAVLQEQIDYWRRQLAGLPAVLSLPTDRPRPAVRRAVGAHQSHALPKDLALALRELSREQGVTLFMTLLAAFEHLLSRYSGQELLAVGTPIAGRSHVELEPLVGFFINTLVLRGDLTGDPNSEDLLGRTRTTVLEAYAHQDLPFERLVEELAPVRSLSHNPLFQVMLVLHNTPQERLELRGLTLGNLPVSVSASKFDLALALIEGPHGLAGALEYDTALFDRTTAQRLLAQLELLLAQVVHARARPLSALILLGEAERHQMLWEWRPAAGPLALAGAPSLYEVFAVAARRHPERPAALLDEEEVSYGELERRVGRLARRLRSSGVGPEILVAVCLDRSLDALAALLAVLRAGGVFLPVDPETPQDRLAWLLEDSGAALVLTRRALAGGLGQYGRPVLVVEPESGEERAASGEALPCDPRQAAYVIYTSGSTGTPKAVCVSHGAAAAHVAAVPYAYGLTPDDRVLQFSASIFDVSLEQIFAAFQMAATVVLRGNDLWEPAGLLERARRCGITVANLPTSYWHQMMHELEPEALRATPLRVVIPGGEALLSEPVLAWQETGIALVNAYGPTEAVMTACRFIAGPGFAPRSRVPIGRPFGDRVAVVLDRDGEPAPAGVAGELYLGGLLARGYLGRPGLTAERFVPDGQGTWGDRLYRTGDLVRSLADGNLEFLGRSDGQVKVRGFRIELGEIEAVLGGAPGVALAAVLAVPAGPGDLRLVSWLVPQARMQVDLARVRGHLQARLPGYMQPSSYRVTEVLPLTPTGKIDRKGLTSLVGEMGAAVSERSEPPQGPVEEMVAAVWEEVLGSRLVGRDDSFFDLGGHSLLALGAISRLRATMGVDLPLKTLFEAPTVRGVARAVAERQAKRRGAAETAFEVLPRDGSLPTSFAQRRIWLLHQLDPRSAAYHIALAVRLSGDLQPGALAAAWREIARRHEVLRATFHEEGGEPVQRAAAFDAAYAGGLSCVDLSSLPHDRRESAWRHGFALLAREPFDLERGPVLRNALFRVEPCEHILGSVAHHIVADAGSMSILVRELAALYGAFLAGRPSPLEPLSFQYADFAAWQRRSLTGAALANLLAYWRERLAGAAALELPTDRPRPAVPGNQGGRVSFTYPVELRDACLALGRQESATPFMVLLAGMVVLLARHGTGEDLTVGIPMAQRDRPEIEPLVGLFLNTLVLRIGLDGDPSGRDLVRRVRKVALEAFAHQGLPFEVLVEALQPQRDLSRSPLFQVLFNLLGAALPVLEMPGLDAVPVAGGSGETKFDLSLSIRPAAHGLVGALEYRKDLFDGVSLQRMAARFEVLLAALTSEPERSFRELPLLNEPERQQIAREWNDTGLALLDETLLLHGAFERQAGRTPRAEALVFLDSRLTYAELDRRADSLACRLSALGIGPESRVGVFLERSVELVVALLGILKAGGAYLPLDPDYPAGRLSFLIEDGRTELVLTRADLRERLPAGVSSSRVLELDGEAAEDFFRESRPSLTPDHLAYVLYTSGSTGQPKGSMITHRGICNRLLWMQRAYSLVPDDRVLQKTPFSFDVSLWEFFWPLSVGACLVLARPQGHRENDYLAELIERERITTLHFVPSMLQAFLDAPESAGLTTLRRVVCSGEALSAELRDRALERLPAALHNLYGPTEASVDVTAWACERGVGRTVPIGRPIDNHRLHVLDAGFALAPLGAAGELCIGGLGLARGYLGIPDLTAARFVPDLLAVLPGERLYRTGDLARHRHDGAIEYLGRLDHQVKLRGVRIELGEIEAVLGRHPTVRQVAVMVRGREAMKSHLVAYVMPAAGGSVPTAALRDLAREALPEAMVPARFVTLESFPLTSSGKLDRRALPDDGGTGAGPGAAEPGAARTPLEELVLETWSAVLGGSGVGLESDFFELGGHSLSAAQVASRLCLAVGRDVPLRLLFQQPVAGGFAAALEALLREGKGLGLPPLERVERDRDLPLSHAQQRLWFFDHLQPGTAAFNLPRTVRLQGPLDLPALERALGEVVRRHETLRTLFPDRDGVPVQSIGDAWAPAIAAVDLAGLPEASRHGEALRLRVEEARRPFVLAAGRLLRTVLLRLAPDDHRLLITLHHIVSDGWSMGVLAEELTVLYGAFARGESSPLPELAIQYADYAAWQRRWLEGERGEALLGFWRRHLAGASALHLPTDRPRPEVPTGHGPTHGIALGADLTARIQELGRREGATLFMVLLAAFEAVLHHASGQEDVVVGTDHANREHPEVERLIGFFINQIVLRTDLSGSPPFRELLARVRRTTLEAYTHRDLPFERLVEEVNPRRSLRSAPLFQVKLIVQNTPAVALRTGGPSPEAEQVDLGAAQLDLTLSLAPAAAGLLGWVNFREDLFDAATVARLVRRFESLLAAVVAEPETRLHELAHQMTESERKATRIEGKSRMGASLQRFKSVQPKAVTMADEELVRMDYLSPGQTLPLVVTPAVSDVDLAAWSSRNRARVERELERHGAILFRGFAIDSPAEMERFARTVCDEPCHENGEHPRESAGGDVRTPVSPPSDQQLLWYNESSLNWPRKILSCCVKPAESGAQHWHVSCLADLPRHCYLGGGSPIQDGEMGQILDVYRSREVVFPWQKGDVMLVDNVLVAHGRNPYQGERKLLVSLADMRSFDEI